MRRYRPCFAGTPFLLLRYVLHRSIARDREDRRKASQEQERLESTGMEPERAAKEAAAIANQGARRRTKPPSLVLLDAATEEAMKKEAVLKRDRGDGATSGEERTADPSTAARKRVKTEKGGSGTRTAAVGAGLGALLQRERERERAVAAQDNGSGGPEISRSGGAQKRTAQPDHISLRTETDTCWGHAKPRLCLPAHRPVLLHCVTGCATTCMQVYRSR